MIQCRPCDRRWKRHGETVRLEFLLLLGFVGAWIV